MKTTKYIGDFQTFQLEINCFGFNQAYYLLVAKAISEIIVKLKGSHQRVIKIQF